MSTAFAVVLALAVGGAVVLRSLFRLEDSVNEFARRMDRLERNFDKQSDGIHRQVDRIDRASDRGHERFRTLTMELDSLARRIKEREAGFDRRCDEQQALLLRILAVLEPKNEEKPVTSGGE
jgi:seryl-tRNA synthetase